MQQWRVARAKHAHNARRRQARLALPRARPNAAMRASAPAGVQSCPPCCMQAHVGHLSGPPVQKPGVPQSSFLDSENGQRAAHTACHGHTLACIGRNPPRTATVPRA
eukprot:366331-Chlamydomonas_euryale.AAC.25